MLTSNLVLQGVCQEIFDSLLELVEARHQAIHLVNYADKWNRLKKLMHYTLDNLYTMEIASQQEALQNWFEEVCNNMEEVELKTNISRQSQTLSLYKSMIMLKKC